jgi:hypothetical protein
MLQGITYLLNTIYKVSHPSSNNTLPTVKLLIVAGLTQL